MSANFPEMLKTSRQDAGLTFRQLREKLDEQGTPASITQLNLVERHKMKATYELAVATALATGLDLESALRAAFLSRIRWTVDAEKRNLQQIATEKGLSQEVVDQITRLDL